MSVRRAPVRFVTHRCPGCGAEVGATPSSEIVHPCPKRKPNGPKLTRYVVVDAHTSEPKP